MNKEKTMKSEVWDLLSCLDSEDNKEKSMAIRDIAMVLEMNTYILSGGNNASKLKEYEIYLYEEIASIRLDICEQKEIIDHLLNRIKAKDDMSSSMLWAIGKACKDASLPGLMEAIKCCSCDFDDEESYQAIIAIENLLDSVKEDLQRDEEIVRFLEGKAKSADERLSESSKRVLVKYI